MSSSWSSSAPKTTSGAKKPKFKVKRRHGFQAVLWVLGTLFPPLAVAARFGIGTDLLINTILTICGYIPGHVHNFYIQNIRNNKNNRRTPKWAIRYGLVDDSYLKKKQKKSQWANRYEERLPESNYEGREVDEGQISDPVQAAAASTTSLGENGAPPRTDRLWREEDQSFYSNGGDSEQSTGRWHYPANFEDAEIVPDVSRKHRSKSSGKKKSSKSSRADRWERTEEAYATTDRPKKKKSRTRSDDALEQPEDPLGVGYGNGRRDAEEPVRASSGQGGDEFSHEF